MEKKRSCEQENRNTASRTRSESLRPNTPHLMMTSSRPQYDVTEVKCNDCTSFSCETKFAASSFEMNAMRCSRRRAAALLEKGKSEPNLLPYQERKKEKVSLPDLFVSRSRKTNSRLPERGSKQGRGCVPFSTPHSTTKGIDERL